MKHSFFSELGRSDVHTMLKMTFDENETRRIYDGSRDYRHVAPKTYFKDSVIQWMNESVGTGWWYAGWSQKNLHINFKCPNNDEAEGLKRAALFKMMFL